MKVLFCLCLYYSYRHPFGQNKASDQRQTHCRRGCPVSWIQGGVRSATIYPNRAFPRALQCHPCDKGTSFLVLSSIVLSAPVLMTYCLHSPNFVTSDLNLSDFVILPQDCRGPLAPGYRLIFFGPRITSRNNEENQEGD